jgi:hypothetical protein
VQHPIYWQGQHVCDALFKTTLGLLCSFCMPPTYNNENLKGFYLSEMVCLVDNSLPLWKNLWF